MVRNLWKWLGDESNSRALGIIIIGVPAAFAALTFIYVTLWPIAEPIIIVKASDFWTGENVNIGPANGCRDNLVYNQAPYTGSGNSVTYRIGLKSSGRYQLFVEYAAEVARPVEVAVNSQSIFSGALRNVSGSWCFHQARWDNVGLIELKKGENFIRFSTSDLFPHFKTLKLVLL